MIIGQNDPDVELALLDAKLPPFMKRVIAEGDELAKKLIALQEFMGKRDFKVLDPFDQQLMAMQFNAMSLYMSTLSMRLARARDKARMMQALSAGKPQIN